MEYRRLGRTDLEASRIGFGCSRIAQASGASERRAIVCTLETALDRGINFFDTADSYDHGASEALLGDVFRRQRDRVILCSKAGYRSWLLLALDRWARLSPSVVRHVMPLHRTNRASRAGRERRRNFEPGRLAIAIQGSLRRLRTDRVDVFYLHSPPPDVLADGRVFETLQGLKQKGWIRHYGISCAERSTTQDVLAALRCPGISIVQVMVNPLESVDLEKIAPRAAELGVAIVGRQPFHRGAVLEPRRLTKLQIDCPRRTPAQMVLRSVTQLPNVDVALVGMRSMEHLEENLGSMVGPALSAGEMTRLYSGMLKR